MENSGKTNDLNPKQRNVALHAISKTTHKIGSTVAASATTLVDSSKKAGTGLAQLLKDFKSFLDRGNVIDVAVALVMGAAFTAVVNSFVSDLFSPLIGLMFSKSLSFAYLAIKCPQGLEDQIKKGADLDTIVKNSKGAQTLVNCEDKTQIQRFFATSELANKAGVLTWNYGNFFDKLINLLITGIILFFIVKAYAAAFRRTKPAPKEKECDFCFKSIPVKATRCPNCTSELEIEEEDQEEEENEKSGFLKFPIKFPKKQNSCEKMV